MDIPSSKVVVLQILPKNICAQDTCYYVLLDYALFFNLFSQILTSAPTMLPKHACNAHNVFIFIREYATTPYIGNPARIIFSQLRPSQRKFLFLKILFFSLLSQISSLYLAKPRKYGLLQFWRFHLGWSFIVFFFFFIIRLNFYEAYLRNGDT